MSAWLKKIALFLIPVFALMVLYAAMDPFRIIGELEDSKLGPIASSDDYYGVERFIENAQAGNTYNTYVFGNSKTLAFRAEALCSSNTCSYFNFGAPGESVRNIHDKMQLLLNQGQKLTKVLLVLDHKVLMNENNGHGDFKGPVYEHHPAISRNTWLSFHINFFKYFIRDFFFYDLLQWKLTGNWSPSLEGKISKETSSTRLIYNSLQNFSFRADAENQISNHPESYYSNIAAEMKKQNQLTHQLKLSLPQINLMQEMNQTFLQQDTEFYIVLGPYWNSDQIDEATIETIIGCFGKEHVHDFTGDNVWNSEVKYWYESNHYRPLVGSSIMNQVRGTGF